MTSEVQNCLTIEEFADRHRIGRTTVYAEIKAGRLKVRKVGKRRIITPEDAKSWRDRLPTAHAWAQAGRLASGRAG